MQIMEYTLTPELRGIALDALKAFMQAPAGSDGRKPFEADVDLDQKRVELIENTLKPLVIRFLESSLLLADFKRQVDGINKQHRNIWGFTGIKGQMFFNLLSKAVGDESEFDTQLRLAIREPPDEQSAAEQLKIFKGYVGRVGQQLLEGGGDKRGRPNEGSVPFFISYFWQIQKRDVWPVYYTSTVQAAEDMNLWQETGEVGGDYVTYKRLHEMLVKVFSESSARTFSLYDVEHVFWYKNRQLISNNLPAQPAAIADASVLVATTTDVGPVIARTTQGSLLLPESYVPPIVAVIPKLALNDLEFQEAARRAGTTLEHAFEKSVNAAFTVMGYEAQFLGQGKGRVPDGVAIAVEDSYAIVWDAKARSDGYRMGTDDRAIRQYIDDQSRNLRRRGSRIQNIYYLIISSKFSGEFEDSIQELKMATGVNEVCLVEAEAIVAIVDQKPRRNQAISLGSDGIQRLFSSSCIIDAKYVMEKLA